MVAHQREPPQIQGWGQGVWKAPQKDEGAGHTRGMLEIVRGEEVLQKKSVPLCKALEQRPPTFLAPGTGFVVDNFSTDQCGDSFRLIQVHYIFFVHFICTLYICTMYISLYKLYTSFLLLLYQLVHFICIVHFISIIVISASPQSIRD